MNGKIRHTIVKLAHHIPDKFYLQLFYYKVFGRFIDFKDPRSFSEKLQWLKLYDRKPLYSKLVDKYEAKEYVASQLGKEHIIPTIGVWDNVEDINFDELPEQFVIKCTHDSGSIVICKEKFQLDREAAKQKLLMGMQRNGYWYGREWPYKNVKPRIIAEDFMIDESGEQLKDYKFFCFNGVVKCFKIDFDRYTDHRANYYDTNGNIISVGERVCPPKPDANVSVPTNLKEMIAYAEVLSQNIPFVRVDFYYVNGTVYFGEMTFFPAAGLSKFISEESDLLLGNWLKLPVQSN